MKPKRKMILPLSLASLAIVSGCVAPGNFCEVVSGPIQFPAQVAAVVVQGARPEAVRIDAINRFGEANCGW